jgi:hypothetical protein
MSPGVPKLAVAAIAVGAFAMGLTGGALFIKSRLPAASSGAAEGTGAAPAKTGAEGVPAAGGGADSSSGDKPAPATSGSNPAADQTEIAKLRLRVAELEKLVPKEKTKEDKIAIAKEMIECIRKGKTNPEAFRRLLQLISELDPAMGPYFLERVADETETADRNTLIDLALSAGGPEVADWVLAKLADAGTSDDTRRRLLRTLGGGTREIFNIRNFPVQGALADTAFQYASSTATPERQAAAGLLGGVDTVESRTVLRRLASSDTEPGVIEQAIRSLGIVGDKETLTWLESWRPPAAPDGDWQAKRLEGTITASKEALQKKFGR